MRASELEAWALRVYGLVKTGRVEDARVELKADWPEPTQAARRIAAHANAAHAEPILWLVGVQEGGGAVATSAVDVADWWAQVSAEFADSVVPLMSDILVIPPDSAGAFHALLFETDRAPYLVKNPLFGKQGGGSVSWEVPWREGTSTRSARRPELLSILAPASRLPLVEILDASAHVNMTSHFMTAHANLYVVPFNRQRLVFPHHWQQAELTIRATSYVFATVVLWVQSDAVAATVQGLQQIVLDGPAPVQFHATANLQLHAIEVLPTVDLIIKLRPAWSNQPVVVVGELAVDDAADVTTWRLRH